MEPPSPSSTKTRNQRMLLILVALLISLFVLGSSGIGPFAFAHVDSANSAAIRSIKQQQSSHMGDSSKTKTNNNNNNNNNNKIKKNKSSPKVPPLDLTAAPPAGYYHPIAGVYVFYRRPRSFMHTIDAYRMAYPTENLYLFCDQGCYNYTNAATHYKAHFDGTAREIVAKNTDGAFYTGASQAKQFLIAYRSAVNAMTEPFFIQLEDDVNIIKPVVSALRYDINGWADDKSVMGAAAEYVYARNPKAPATLTLGGFGGCIFRTSFWKKILNEPSIEAEIDALYGQGSVHAYGVDYIFSSLAYRFNGTVGNFDGYVEMFDPKYPKMKELDTVEVLHGYKVLYKDNVVSGSERDILGGSSAFMTPIV